MPNPYLPPWEYIPDGEPRPQVPSPNSIEPSRQGSIGHCVFSYLMLLCAFIVHFENPILFKHSTKHRKFPHFQLAIRYNADLCCTAILIYLL